MKDLLKSLVLLVSFVMLIAWANARGDTWGPGGGSEGVYGPGSSGGGTSLPWSSTGDTLYYSAGAAALPAGTDGQFYRQASGIPSWVTIDSSMVTENTNLYFTNARAIAATLTGYASGAGTISASDSVLGAIQKLNGNVALNAPLASPTFTGTVTLPSGSVTSSAWDTGTSGLTVNGVAFSAKAPSASPTFTGTVTMPGGSLTSSAWAFGNYHLEPSEVDDGNSGTADTIDWSAGSAHKSTLTGNVTYTFSNPVTGGAYALRVLTGAGSFTATWPATVKWAGGTAPTITTTASRMDLINFYYDGTNYYGSYTQNYTP